MKTKHNYSVVEMPAQTSHCRSEQCKESAEMLCTHESVLAMQYELDQTRMSMARFMPQQNARCTMDMLVWDKGQFTNEYELMQCNGGIKAGGKLSNERLSEFYLPMCTAPIFNNRLIESQSEVCSYTHQLYGNHTRAGTGSTRGKTL